MQQKLLCAPREKLVSCSKRSGEQDAGEVERSRVVAGTMRRLGALKALAPTDLRE